MILLGQDRCNTKGGFRHVALLRSRAQVAGFVRCFGLHGRCSRLVHDEHAKPGTLSRILGFQIAKGKQFLTEKP